MKNTNQKKRILILLQTLQKYSDENHPLKMSDLIQYCYDQGIHAERRSIYDDIRELKEAGYEILFTRIPYQGYFLATQPFEMAELRLLSDAVQASNFVTEKKSRQLVNKLAQLTSVHQGHALTKQVYFFKHKFSNEEIFYTIDQFQQAIANHYAVCFQYFDITVNKQKKYRRQAREYHLIPYALIWENQRYYCIGYDTRYQNFTHYRLDKIDHLTMIEEVQKKMPFDMHHYASRVFNMFQGESTNITLRFDLSLINTVFDQFGQDVLITEVSSESFTINLTMGLAPTFIGWLLQFGQRVTVLSPQKLIDQMQQVANEVLHQYKEKSQ